MVIIRWRLRWPMRSRLTETLPLDEARNLHPPKWDIRADSRSVPSQLETALLCNDVSQFARQKQPWISRKLTWGAHWFMSNFCLFLFHNEVLGHFPHCEDIQIDKQYHAAADCCSLLDTITIFGAFGEWSSQRCALLFAHRAKLHSDANSGSRSRASPSFLWQRVFCTYALLSEFTTKWFHHAYNHSIKVHSPGAISRWGYGFRF